MTIPRGLFCLALAGSLAGCISMPGAMKIPSFAHNHEKTPTGPPTPVTPEAITTQNAHAQANALWDEIDWEDRKDREAKCQVVEHHHSHK